MSSSSSSAGRPQKRERKPPTERKPPPPKQKAATRAPRSPPAIKFRPPRDHSDPYAFRQKLRQDWSDAQSERSGLYAEQCNSAAVQFMDPQRQQEAVMCPDDSTNERCVRRFSSRFPIQSSLPGCEDGFTLTAIPSLKAPITYTGAAGQIPAAGPGALAIRGRWNTDGANVISGSQFIATDSNGNNATQKLTPIVDSLGVTMQGLILSQVGTANSIDTYLALSSQGSAGARTCKCLFYYKTAGGPWTLQMTAVLGHGSPEAVTFFGHRTCSHVGFVMTTSGGESHAVAMRYATVEDYQAQLTAVAAVDLGRGEVVAQLSEAQGGRLIGMTVLVTNTSDKDGCGGTITAARVPNFVSPFETTAAINSAIPQNNFYQSLAEFGAYAFWLPRNADSKTYRQASDAQDALNEDSYLYVNMAGWGGANLSSVQVTVTYVVEFYIASQLYEKRIPPPRLPMWDAYEHSLALMPGAMCNPSHVDMFRNGINRAKAYTESVLGHYNKHKKLYDALFAQLVKMAA